MQVDALFLHNECPYYISEYYIGFRQVMSPKGSYYVGKKYTYNTLVFMLEGEVEFSYNQYIGNRFQKGDLIFIPQASYMYGVAVTDTRMLVLTYDLAMESHCSNCVLSKMKFDITGIEEVEYDFQPLKMTEEIIQFAELIMTYIDSDYRCRYLHELKQKELFIIMQYAYTREQMMQFFYPILGDDVIFRTKVLRLAHEQLTTEEYAERLNMGTRSFLRKFKVEFGQTVHQWTLQHKMAQIKLKLSMPNVSVTDIVREFNFADTSHFYRFCKEHFGFTAKELISQFKRQNAIK